MLNSVILTFLKFIQEIYCKQRDASVADKGPMDGCINSSDSESLITLPYINILLIVIITYVFTYIYMCICDV